VLADLAFCGIISVGWEKMCPQKADIEKVEINARKIMNEGFIFLL
jgi:hypothetical protein